MSQNIHAYLIVMIIGKTSTPETGITTGCWLQPKPKTLPIGSAFMTGPPSIPPKIE